MFTPQEQDLMRKIIVALDDQIGPMSTSAKLHIEFTNLERHDLAQIGVKLGRKPELLSVDLQAEVTRWKDAYYELKNRNLARDYGIGSAKMREALSQAKNAEVLSR